MTIQKSGSWNNKGNDLTEDELITPFPVKPRKDKNKVTEESHVEEDIKVNKESDKVPMFNKNFYLDEEMYEKFNNSKSNKSELLDSISTTSEKEDKVFIQISLTFVVCLLIVCVIEFIFNTLVGKEINSWNSMRYILAITLTYLVTKLTNNKNKGD